MPFMQTPHIISMPDTTLVNIESPLAWIARLGPGRYIGPHAETGEMFIQSIDEPPDDSLEW